MGDNSEKKKNTGQLFFMRNPYVKFKTSFNSLKVTVGTKSVTHARTHPRTLQKQYAQSTFSKLGVNKGANAQSDLRLCFSYKL